MESIIERRREAIILRMETMGELDPSCERCAKSYRYEDPADGAKRYGTHREHEAQQRANRRRGYMLAIRTIARLAVDEGLTDSADVIADVAAWEIIDDQRATTPKAATEIDDSTYGVATADGWGTDPQRAAAQDDARGEADR